MIHYARSNLARELAEQLQGKQVFNDAYNGLFLAAPRRTGKSTFLQLDLQPALEAQRVVVVYVDLWSDQRRDPGSLIADAIARSLQSHLGLVAKAARASGLESVSIGGMKIDTRKIGQIDGVTLVEALKALHETAKAPIALVIDEAQHALTSEAGENAMAALKSARDQLNRPGEIQLMLVMSGSDRDKLLRLVNTNGAPFYGSQIRRMPALDQDFIAHIVRLIEGQRPELAPVDAEALFKAFEGFGHRPQFFMEALGQALSPLDSFEGRFESAVLAAAAQRQKADEAQMESDFLGLRPIEQAVLWRMLEQGPLFRPYDAEALRFYQEKAGQKVSAQKAQNALESLRARLPALVWKSARGEYAVDDAAMHRWYAQRVTAGTWPPQGPQIGLDLEEDV
ncbi:AAA family ATPase [Thauera humireducens]|uniref:AAA family ATPase n=1 Tax=Thauera humireducens TaxID=1134435 RepID=UPI00311F3C90